MANAKDGKKTNAIEILKSLGFVARQSNDVAAQTLLAVLGLKPNAAWGKAANPLCGITPIIEFIRESYGVHYAPNTRETIRDEAVKHFVEAGLLLRNPIIPALVMLLWESINGFLPELLQKLSVLHYLQSICPVPPPMDPNVPPLLRLVLAPAAPTSASVAIVGVLGVTALVLYVASRAVRRLEINYGTE